MMPRFFNESSMIIWLSVFSSFYADCPGPRGTQRKVRIDRLWNHYNQQQYCDNSLTDSFERRKRTVHSVVSAEPPCRQFIRLVKVYFRVYASCDVLNSMDRNECSSVEPFQQIRYFLLCRSPGNQFSHLMLPP